MSTHVSRAKGGENMTDNRSVTGVNQTVFKWDGETCHEFFTRLNQSESVIDATPCYEKIDCEQTDKVVMFKSHAIHLCECHKTCPSPFFRVCEEGDVYVRLEMLEVVYPTPLYENCSKRQATMLALRDGVVVLQSTQEFVMLEHWCLTLARDVELRVVEDIKPLTLESEEKNCTPMGMVKGQFKSDNPNYGILTYYLLQKPKYGHVELDALTGEWTYEDQDGEQRVDAFECLVYDDRGSYQTVKQLIAINSNQEKFHVENERLDLLEGGEIFGKTFSTGLLNELGVFVSNEGEQVIKAIIQYSPDGKEFVDEGVVHRVKPSQMKFIVPIYYTPYTRVKLISDEAIKSLVWYHGHLDI